MRIIKASVNKDARISGIIFGGMDTVIHASQRISDIVKEAAISAEQIGPYSR